MSALPPMPWHISSFEVNAGGSQRVIMAADGFGVAWISGRSVAEHEAIASAILHAPEMLNALKQAEVACAELCNEQHPKNQCWVTLATVRAAIAKAEYRP